MMIRFGMIVLICCVFGDVAGRTVLASEALFTQQLSAEELVTALSADDWTVVDARSTDAFNGWALDGMDQGGHIPGAIDFPADWLRNDVSEQEEQIARILQSKRITPSKKIVVYSLQKQDRQRVAEFLKRRNCNELYSFDLRDWLESKRRLKRYPQYQRLLPPVVVKQLIDGELPATFQNSKRVKLAEVSWGDESASYAKGHVPGSFHVNTDHFEPPPKWYLGDPKVLSKFASVYGFQADDTVIISGEDVTASYRLAVVLEYMGVADTRVLNGGLAAWKRAGYSVETKKYAAPTSAGFGANIPGNPSLIVSSDVVKNELSKRGNFALVDTRTWAEFVGEKSGYSYHFHKGRIPGSIYGQADYKGPNSVLPYRNIDGTMRNADEIMTLWRTAGISTNDHLCFLCGGGWRAAEVLTYARVIGIDQTTLYSDGWIGWSNDRNNPVESGPPK